MASAAKASEKYHQKRNQGNAHHHHDPVSAGDGSHGEGILLKAVYKKVKIAQYGCCYQDNMPLICPVTTRNQDAAIAAVSSCASALIDSDTAFQACICQSQDSCG